MCFGYDERRSLYRGISVCIRSVWLHLGTYIHSVRAFIDGTLSCILYYLEVSAG